MLPSKMEGNNSFVTPHNNTNYKYQFPVIGHGESENKTERQVADTPIEQTIKNRKIMAPEVNQPVKNEFVPLWMPVAAFVLIVIAYVYTLAVGIHVNEYRMVGAIGISGLFAVVCMYFKYK